LAEFPEAVTERPVGVEGTEIPDVPVPFRIKLFGLLPAFVVKVRKAVRAAATVGRKTTPTTQEAEVTRDAPQVFEEIRKSPGFAPVRLMLPIVRVAVPLFVSVTFCAELDEPTATLAKAMLDEGFRLTSGAVPPTNSNVPRLRDLVVPIESVAFPGTAAFVLNHGVAFVLLNR
jgi:hypothetical protein